ncbi:hypothetical protein CC79DRAFT_1325723 [Sarocladium strictum]
MVQVFYDPTQSQSGTHARDDLKAQAAHQSISRDEHAHLVRDLATKRGIRAPRRGWSMTEAGHAERRHIIHESTLASVSENSSSSSGTSTPISEASFDEILAQNPIPLELPVRPKLPAPRRSYSVQDYEPMPPLQPKPSEHMTILDLPSELHYTLFDFLDPLDGVCLGLAHPRLHDIAKRKYGQQVSLASRYSGPNDMEWAWRGAGPLVRANTGGPPARTAEESKLRPKGQVYCRKCGISRCELHRHLKEWMGEDREYCEIKKIFGNPAGEDAKTYCYMSSPKNPDRCGRHGPRQK